MNTQRDRITKVIKEAWEKCGEVPFPLYSTEAENIAQAVLNAIYDPREVMFLGAVVAIPLGDVQHVERQRDTGGLMVITRHTRWDMEHDVWANNVWIDVSEADAFMEAWTRYLTRPVPFPGALTPQEALARLPKV